MRSLSITVQSSYFLHWLRCTLPQTSTGIAQAILTATEFLPQTHGRWGYAKPSESYKFAARTAEGIRVQTGREDMGTNLEIPGEALTALYALPSEIQTLIHALLASNANFSRLDISIDTIDSRLNILALNDQFEHGECETHCRTHRLLLSDDGGRTLYLGAPQSDRQLRVYNKAAERRAANDIPDAADWIRIELQLRNQPANDAAMMLASMIDMAGIIRTLILHFADFPHDAVWARALRGSTYGIGRSSRHRGNRRKWLLTACAMAFAQERKLDKLFEDEWNRAVASAEAIIDKNGS